jgi:hypothetical protein
LINTGETCNGYVAGAELLAWLGKLAEIEFLPRAGNTGWHDELVCKVISDPGHITTAANNKNWLYFVVVV